jgi:methionyl-tRNA formyltransferase
MRVGFAGTPEFAATALAAIVAAGFTVPLVLTRPDKPRGRGLRFEPSAVKVFALAHELPLQQPATLRTDEARLPVLAVPLDVLVVAAYGLLLPPPVLAWPRHGCLNIHASQLPRWRGAAPIQRALLAGDARTGVTIMQMDAGLDTGPMIATVPVPIDARETAATLHDKLAAAGAAAIVDTLTKLAAGVPLAATPQPDVGSTYAAKIERAEAAIDWRTSAATIDRQIRAFDPAPGAFCTYAGGLVKLWRAEAADGRGGAAGTIVTAGPDGLVVACGDGLLRVTELQPAGGRRMAAAAFVAGRRVAPGQRFEVAAAPVEAAD